jgi:hypothetical protein
MRGLDFGQTAHVQLHYSHVGFLQAAFRYPWMGEGGVFISCLMKCYLTNVDFRPGIL